MIVSFNFYYARPGLAGAVLEQRLRASEVRRRLGLRAGRVLARTEGSDELPDVIWELEFEAVAGHHADMAARAASPEFEAVRAGMRELYRRFERPLFELCGPPAQPPADAQPSRLVTLDWVFCEPQKAAQARALIEHYADLYALQGLDRGRVLRLITPGAALPELVWQHEYADTASHALMQLQLASGAALQTWLSAVRKLSRDFQSSAWRVV